MKRILPLLALPLLVTACGSSPDGDGSPWQPVDGGPDVEYPPLPKECDFSGLQIEKRDGMLYGLPAKNVPVSAPIVTPQTAKAIPEKHFRKQIGVLGLSPKVRDLQAVEHVLRPMGLPYANTTSPKLSLQHDLTIFFPEAYPENFDDDELNTIDMYLANGGTLIIKATDLPKLKSIGGVAKTTFKLPHFRLELTDAGKREFPSLDHPHEQAIPLGGTPSEYLNSWSLDVTPSADTEVLARFDDGTAAIVKHKVGPGVVYTLGLDYRDIIIRNQLGYSLGGSRSYINVFEPATDAFMLMVRDIYDARVEFGVRLHTAPNGARAALLLSHDLDWGPSYENSIAYAKEEKRLGATATYLLHTKYITDAQDEAFFRPDRAPLIAEFLALGMSVGSHTVAHSKILREFPLGDGQEAYPTYKPYNVTKFVTTGGTLFGEGRVSKSLIEGYLERCGVKHNVITFRAGELSFNPATPETLERLGYRFDSSRAVGEVLTNFPYRMMTNWPDANDTSMFEFPVTLEDELPPRLDLRVDAMRDVVAANANNGAPTTLLIHPNVTDYKLDAQQQLMMSLPEGVVSMGLEPYAKFWAARDVATVDAVEYDRVAGTLTVKVSTPEAIDGLTLFVRGVGAVTAPDGAKLVPQSGAHFVALPPLAAGAQTTVVMTLAK